MGAWWGWRRPKAAATAKPTRCQEEEKLDLWQCGGQRCFGIGWWHHDQGTCSQTQRIDVCAKTKTPRGAGWCDIFNVFYSFSICRVGFSHVARISHSEKLSIWTSVETGHVSQMQFGCAIYGKYSFNTNLIISVVWLYVCDSWWFCVLLKYRLRPEWCKV